MCAQQRVTPATRMQFTHLHASCCFFTPLASAALVREVGAGEMRDERAAHRDSEAGENAAVMSERCFVARHECFVCRTHSTFFAVIKATFNRFHLQLLNRFHLLLIYPPPIYTLTNSSCCCPSTSCRRHPACRSKKEVQSTNIAFPQ
jgi:hypothetical protein